MTSAQVINTASPQKILHRAKANELVRAFLFQFLIPAAIYAVCFLLLTYPLILKWRTHFYCDGGDGLQNEWNLWWMKKSIVDLHTSPWFTSYLQAPWGTTLLGHTLNPINGLFGIPLSTFLPPVQVYNTIVIGTFILSGVSAFWLAQHTTSHYIPSLFGGFAFTFTGYHFAHAYGHMQLISMEFLPLFLLAWLRMLQQPSYLRALAAALVLGLVALCDFYYVLYSVMAGAVCVVFYIRHLKRIERKTEPHYVSRRFAVFVVAALLLAGPLIIALVISNARDPLLGAHPDVLYSADALAVFTPGEVNRLGRFTRGYWSNLNNNLTDESVYVGLSVWALAVYGIIRRRALGGIAGIWIAVALLSYALSLGPVLHIRGQTKTGEIMPYAWLETVCPPIRLGGISARFSVMVALAVSMLASIGVAFIWQKGGWKSKASLALMAVIMAIDLWPMPSQTWRPIYPAWVSALRQLPLKGAVICQADDAPTQLYFQTLHERPMAFGYIARTPSSVVKNDFRIMSAGAPGDYATLRREMGFVYVVLPIERKIPSLAVVYADNQVVIQELPGPS